jgi:flagellar assembly protein FliH
LSEAPVSSPAGPVATARPGAVSFDFEQLEASAPPPGNAPARVLAEALVEADSMRAAAHEEGFAQGREEGREHGLSEVAAAAAALGEALEAMQALRSEALEDLERDSIELALALAGKILAGAMQARPELILESVHGALRRLGDRRRVTVIVNPDDLTTVADALAAEGEPRVGGVERLELQGEERVARGGAVVRTDEGEVDASVQTQLERAREVVLAELQALTVQ